MKKFILIVITFWICDNIKSQQWVTIFSSRGNFSFSFPQTASPYDTLSLLTYATILPSDSTIAFQVNYIDSVYMSGNDELQSYLMSRYRITDSSGIKYDQTGRCSIDSVEALLNTYAQMYQVTTQGTIEGYVNSDLIVCQVWGKELTIRHPELSGSGGFYYSFCRYFNWGQKFMAFTVSGPEEKLAELYSYKNQFFNSISLLMIERK